MTTTTTDTASVTDSNGGEWKRLSEAERKELAGELSATAGTCDDLDEPHAWAGFCTNWRPCDE